MNTPKQHFKDFITWIQCKIVLNENIKPIYFKERQIWWCSFGVNIGSEIDGKNNEDSQKQKFTRPVLIIKKLSHYTFIGIPLTSKDKKGTWFYPIRIKESQSNLIFAQVRTLDSRRLQRKMGEINENEFQKIKTSFGNFMSE